MKVDKLILASLMCSAITITQANDPQITLDNKRNIAASISPLNTSALLQRRHDEVVSKKVKEIKGEKFTFIKYLNAEGDVYGRVFDANNKLIDEKELPVIPHQIADDSLLSALSQANDNLLKVNVALNIKPLIIRENSEDGVIVEQEGLLINSMINNKKVGKEKLEALTSKSKKYQSEMNKAMAENTREQVIAWLRQQGIKLVEPLKSAVDNGDDVLTLSLPAAQIKEMIASEDETIAGIELYVENRDDINAAMVDTSITSSALPYSTTRGSGIGIYMTESGCANESRITNYDRLAGSETNHSRNVGAIIRAVSPNSYLYCRGGAVLPQNSDLDGVGGNPDIYIVNRSNGGNSTSSYTTLDRNWDNFVYDHNVATFKSAGNNGGSSGNGTGNISSPGKGLNLITVGNYNGANDTIASGSSFVDPATKNDKPEIVAPGTNITAGGFTMGGTSMSSPHAAAFAADMMSSSTYLKLKPYLVKAKILAGATDPIAGGYDKVGLGGIDFASAQWSGYASWHSGNNGSFTSFANNDGSADQYIERNVYISSGYDNARVVLSWLNRGSYTYNNRNDAHPIGMDLDMRVYDPNGNYIGGSYSWDNDYESVNFSPNVSGYYKIKVNRYANRDTSSNLRMGLYVNYYN